MQQFKQSLEKIIVQKQKEQMAQNKVNQSKMEGFDCSYCKKYFDHQKKQDFCQCDICQDCMRVYFKTRLIKNKVVRNCPKNKDHKIYMDSLLEKPFYRQLFIKNKGNVYYMLLTILIIFLVGQLMFSLDANLQIGFSLLIIYSIKADIPQKQKYYFLYLIYIPIAYWFYTKNALEFMQIISPLHVLWFTFVHLEKDRQTKIKIFFIWVSQIVWQLIFGFLRYYLYLYFD